MNTFPEKLSDGYFSFLSGKFHTEQKKYERLAVSGQNPEIMVIGCCDSRVSPEVIFDTRPGEIFVVRNVANLVPPFEDEYGTSYHGTSAAIEFAVNGLNIEHIVVLGHASCGGIKSFIEDRHPLSKMDFIGKWMSQITPVAEKLNISVGNHNHEDTKRLEFGVINHSINNLLSFPSVRTRVNERKLHIHGAYFLISTGTLFIKKGLDFVSLTK
ncbi:carbonic anhydrase [Candidatus Kinetoplastibacterium blastocrithidii TCC012E]|uniref:Carbonic anhydrase n=1 Tax=Candidatus Kinetoplastidibacterium blastocrithidiae TCC012E TaxID=1208922 RepID=M1MCK1_9PROT|nr:carbonic anhydrase [Candidatus Kinetoplastibacterium blastocrithidii]AFZ83429.1 carbonic anhydrase [Candidatus Kinetoplastibacterium blastocrithidii (ex Strigomonas culicis)]AGF49525.1 carbonic anhydrase [Candidatus Kinetoplastibacterium blastocrithidii TCC012E]